MNNSPMDCTAASELFPWYLNGTLTREETAALEAHVESCPRCRKEHQDTAFAAAAYSTHPAAEWLVRYAFHEMKMGPERTLLEHHLRICPSCAEELELVEASRDRQHLETPAEAAAPDSGVAAPLPFRRPQTPPPRRWQLGAIAASLVAVLAAGYWLWTLEGPSGTAGPGGPSTAGLEGPTAGHLPGREEASFTVTSADNAALRRDASGDIVLELEPGVSEIALTLHFDIEAPSGALELEVLDSVQRRVWWGGALSPTGATDLRALLPAEALPDGELELRIRRREGPRRGTVARSPLRVVRLPR